MTWVFRRPPDFQQPAALDAALIPPAVAVSGAVAITEADDTLAAAVSVVISASLALTEQNDTLVSTGAVAISAAVAITEGDDTLAATGTTGNPVVTDEDAKQPPVGWPRNLRPGELLYVPNLPPAPSLPARSASVRITEEDDVLRATVALGEDPRARIRRHALAVLMMH